MRCLSCPSLSSSPYLLNAKRLAGASLSMFLPPPPLQRLSLYFTSVSQRQGKQTPPTSFGFECGSVRFENEANVLTFWHQYFVLKENMLEVDCPCVTPEVVLKTSGYVNKFIDIMVKDEKTGACYRADHFLKYYCNEKLENDPRLTAE
ncbi:glycyl-tRNA synthetase / glycine-tRNA ligase [Perilla frutescens var. hirtella]|nr:glycyl-tRNA synthetase / glycine-tRNA ligase [Perilla frutescens var. hirtella]